MKCTTIAALFVLPFSPLLTASTIEFDASGTPTGGNQPASASAIFMTGLGTISITLNNLEANPKAAGQLLSDISFTIGGISSPTATLSSATGVPLTISSTAPHPFTTGSPVDLSTLGVHWTVTSISGGLHLSALTMGPMYTVIGPPDGSGNYSNANASLLGNHNPFLESGATFTLSVPGVTSASLIDSAIFSFNTDAGFTIPGVLCTDCGGGGGGGETPEPMTMALTGSALVGLSIFTRRLRRSN